MLKWHFNVVIAINEILHSMRLSHKMFWKVWLLQLPPRQELKRKTCFWVISGSPLKWDTKPLAMLGSLEMDTSTISFRLLLHKNIYNKEMQLDYYECITQWKISSFPFRHVFQGLQSPLSVAFWIWKLSEEKRQTLDSYPGCSGLLQFAVVLCQGQIGFRNGR